MFVAWRDLRFAKGRFALMGTVVVLMTLLVGLLSGLSAGLAAQSTSAITGLKADHLVFAEPGSGSLSFGQSTVTREQAEQYARVPGVTSAEPIAVSTASATAGERTATLAAFGVRNQRPGTVVLSTDAADALTAREGDQLTLQGQKVTVSAISGDDSYSHLPVVWTHLAGPNATVLAVTADPSTDIAAADARLGTRTVTKDDALSAIGSYSAENGSLQLMRGFLFVISALVIGAFFTVWTIQRSRDIAVLKALGATTKYLLRDALGQVVVLLAGGTALGTGLAAALGAVASGTVPFVLSAGTLLGPAAVLVVLGVLGAALAVRRITSVDPLTALTSGAR
ncbi:ABC transporter permease [Amycolatopsis rubida]|uniref:Putative ABC transport system permease protein n=1 Tax=Amycolatopsis rubida TaxID=112413 RepID=A0A1I5PQC1_9PSEU|nr:ABC transporter permease [Amycolatopsis rubida]SFP36205.1 putative ABC transport system permease protein [Amycolatopsis rubida]